MRHDKQLGIMKAQPASPANIGRLGATALAQPKFRGQRARTIWIDEETPVLLSSYGIPFQFLSHILEALRACPRLSYDGELYRHDPQFTQEHINSILNRTTNPHPDAQLIQYHIFDLAETGPQWQRIMRRDQALSVATPVIQLAETKVIPVGDWQLCCADYLSAGYEGIILRSLSNLYRPLDHRELAKRPSEIIKFKPTERDEYEIIGFREGINQYEGALGAIQVRGADGSSFYVGTGFSRTERFDLWSRRSSLLGQTLIVKHEPIRTVGGLPICTVACAVVNRKPRLA